MTARDLISRSFRLMGVLATGEVPSANEANDALIALNLMIDGFSNESLLIFTKLREVFNLVAGQQTYQMGLGAQFNTLRPQKIETALIVVQGNNPETELPMKIINKDEFAAIFVKSIQSTIPLWLYNDDAFPYTNLNLWPVPSINTQLVLYSWKPLADLQTLDDQLNLPPGYARMLNYNLAVELAPEFGRQLDEAAIAIAIQSKEEIKRMNSKPLYMRVDDALAGPRGSFNWLTGDTV